MYIADPITARSLHRAELITAAQRRRSTPAVPNRHRPSLRHSIGAAMARLARPKRPTPFDRQFAIVAGLNDRRLQEFESHFEVRRVDAGQVLARQGELVDEFGLVLAGRVGVLIDDEIVGVLEPGTSYGSLPLLHPVGHAVHKVSLHALEKGLVAIASVERFHALLAEFPSVDGHVRNVARRRRAYFSTRASNPEPIRYPTAVG